MKKNEVDEAMNRLSGIANIHGQGNFVKKHRKSLFIGAFFCSILVMVLLSGLLQINEDGNYSRLFTLGFWMIIIAIIAGVRGSIFYAGNTFFSPNFYKGIFWLILALLGSALLVMYSSLMKYEGYALYITRF